MYTQVVVGWVEFPNENVGRAGRNEENVVVPCAFEWEDLYVHIHFSSGILHKGQIWDWPYWALTRSDSKVSLFLIVLQPEPSPPHSRHLSSRRFEPSIRSQPTGWNFYQVLHHVTLEESPADAKWTTLNYTYPVLQHVLLIIYGLQKLLLLI